MFFGPVIKPKLATGDASVTKADLEAKLVTNGVFHVAVLKECNKEELYNKRVFSGIKDFKGAIKLQPMSPQL